MNKVCWNLSKLLVAAIAISFSGGAFAEFADDDYFDNFPAMCSEARDRQPLPGHVLRIGFIAQTSFGWAVLSPEKRNDRLLQRIPLLDNAGVIGQMPDDDFSDEIRARTRAGNFVVAHVFVGNPDSEPVVTCVSSPISLAQYRPAYYGPSWEWLDSSNLSRWLNVRAYRKWDWQRYWNFNKIRTRFSSYWSREGSGQYSKFKRYHWRGRDRDRDRDRDDNRGRRGRDDDRRWKERDRDRDGDNGKFRRKDDGKPFRKIGDNRNRKGGPKIPETLKRSTTPDADLTKGPSKGRGWRARDNNNATINAPGLIKGPSGSARSDAGKKVWSAKKPLGSKAD